MSETIGAISRGPIPPSLATTPDLAFINRNETAIDRQVRFLEQSGMGNALSLAAQIIPGAHFEFDEYVGIFLDGVRAGYRLTGREHLVRGTRIVGTGYYRSPGMRKGGYENRTVGITVSANVGEGLLTLSPAEIKQGFIFDDEKQDDTKFQGVGIKYEEGLEVRPEDGPNALFRLIGKSGFIPLEDQEAVRELMEVADVTYPLPSRKRLR